MRLPKNSSRLILMVGAIVFVVYLFSTLNRSRNSLQLGGDDTQSSTPTTSTAPSPNIFPLVFFGAVCVVAVISFIYWLFTRKPHPDFPGYYL